MIKRFIEWFNSLFKKEILYKVVFVNDIPNEPRSKIVYIIQNEGYYWQAVMICPCGCKKLLHMNLIREDHPSWEIEFDKNRVATFHPSINRTVGCKSHFFLKKEKIEWC